MRSKEGQVAFVVSMHAKSPNFGWLLILEYMYSYLKGADLNISKQ